MTGHHQLDAVVVERDELRRRIDAALQVHEEFDGMCGECSTSMPCETRRALEPNEGEGAQ